MSTTDHVDYDLMKDEQAQAVLDTKFNEFRDQVADIIALARKQLDALVSEYDDFINYDELVYEINDQIIIELKF